MLLRPAGSLQLGGLNGLEQGQSAWSACPPLAKLSDNGSSRKSCSSLRTEAAPDLQKCTAGRTLGAQRFPTHRPGSGWWRCLHPSTHHRHEDVDAAGQGHPQKVSTHSGSHRRKVFFNRS